MDTQLDGDAIALGKVLAAVRDLVLVVDVHGTIVYINHVEEGYNREAVLGMQAVGIMAPESQTTFSSVLSTVFATGEPQEYEIRTSSPAGEIQWYRSRMSPILEAGQVVSAMIQATNVSALKVAEAELDQLRRLLPMCAWCGRIREEEGTWTSVEVHLEKVGGAKVSHGMCPGCENQMLLMPEEGPGRGNVA